MIMNNNNNNKPQYLQQQQQYNNVTSSLLTKNRRNIKGSLTQIQQQNKQIVTKQTKFQNDSLINNKSPGD